MLAQDGQNQPPSPSTRATVPMGTEVASSCQPVSTSAGTATAPRFRITVPAAQPTAAVRARATPSGACA